MRRSVLMMWWLVALRAWGQLPTSELEQQWLDGAARGGLLVGNGQTLAKGAFRVGSSLGLSYGGLSRVEAGRVAPLLRERVGLQLFGAVGLTPWLELSANVPVVAYQASDAALGLPPAGMGTPLFSATISLVGEDKVVAVSGSLGLGLPIGARGVPGSGGLMVVPRVTVGKVHERFQYGLELAGLVRRALDLGEATGGGSALVASQVSFAAMLASVSAEGPRGEVSVRVFAPLAEAGAGIEGLVGVRWPLGSAELYGGVGPGYLGAPSTPQLRAYLGVAFTDTRLVQLPCVEGRPYLLSRCPELDFDGDGVVNGADRAPEQAEDLDGFADDDGVPDPDNDADGVLDGADRCPNASGPVTNAGCPDGDGDGDGIVDRLDACPLVAEDRDGFRDEDGCPDPDNDDDGTPDTKDLCPLEPGPLETQGCAGP
jgi:OOP family OmpA-OmpF porin